MDCSEINPIDFHVHIGPSRSLGFDISLKKVKREMEEADIIRASIMCFPSYAEDDGEEANDMILEACEENEEFIPIYCLNRHLPEPESRFRTLKWHWIGGVPDSTSNYDTLERNDLGKFADMVRDLDLPMIFEEELKFTELFVEKFPDLKLVIPHLGKLGGRPEDFLETFKNDDNVYFDTSLGPKSTIENFLDEIGHERIIFGSDLPFGRMKREIDKILSLDIEKEKREEIIKENAKRLLKL